MNVSCESRAASTSGLLDAIFPRYIGKNPDSTVPACAAHDGGAPILEMTRAYGPRPIL